MLEATDWGDVSGLDVSVTKRSNTPLLAHVFMSYLSGEIDFPTMQDEVVAVYRTLRRAGQKPEAISGFVSRALDRGAGQATPGENVYRFNAIHDELRFWVARSCTDSAVGDLREFQG